MQSRKFECNCAQIKKCMQHTAVLLKGKLVKGEMNEYMNE